MAERLRLFSRINVRNAAGRKKRRNMGVRKPCQTVKELAERYSESLKRQANTEKVTSVTIAVCRPPQRGEILDWDGEDILDHMDADEDGCFMWRFDEDLSKQVITFLRPFFPMVQFQAQDFIR